LRNSASSLLALSAAALLVAGCGESTTHSSGEVQRAFAAEGIELRGVYGAGGLGEVVPRSERTFAYRLAHSLTTLASRRTDRWLAGAKEHDELFVFVTQDAFEAQHQLREPGVVDLGKQFGIAYERNDNVLVTYEDRDRDVVRRALARL
jgi:hypothetical protein